MSNKKDLSYLGETYQIKIFNQIISDKPFASSIILSMDEKYFDNRYFKLFLTLIKEYYKKYETTPNFETLKQLIKTELNESFIQNVMEDMLYKIREVDIEDSLYVQDLVTKFCKQQALQNAIERSSKIIDEGDFLSYDKVSTIIQDALRVGEKTHDFVDVASNLDDVLEDDYRDPIPTGISGIDEKLGGGLGRGEVGLIFAPPGIGKTTFTTKVANHAYNKGYNVLQIFFEDNIKVIQRKHFTLWTEISSSEFGERKHEVKEMVERFNQNRKNRLILEKLPSESVNMLQIRDMIKRIIADGIKIDVIILDYVDCVLPHNTSGNEWKDEASIMRKFEAMCSEFNVAGWVATQGSRDSISAEIVTNDKVGGSVKKIAIAHVIITVAKTMQQKESKLATMAITKSRLGPDGIVFENCLYDNEMLRIDTKSHTTFLGHKEHKEEDKQERIKALLKKAGEMEAEYI